MMIIATVMDTPPVFIQSPLVCYDKNSRYFLYIQYLYMSPAEFKTPSKDQKLLDCDFQVLSPNFGKLNSL